jgi:anti-sigma factor RsiW
MCNFSGKLIAWMDGELVDNEAVNVERHVRDCSECRSRVEAYEDVSRLLVTYCDAAAAGAKPRRKLLYWAPVLSGAVAAAVLLFMFRPAPVKQMPVVARVADAAPARVLETLPKAVRVQRVHPRHEIAPVKNSRVDWTFDEPAIQISIPAEAMFPPGAVPEGITFVADVSMASDGSVQGLRIQQ